MLVDMVSGALVKIMDDVDQLLMVKPETFYDSVHILMKKLNDLYSLFEFFIDNGTDIIVKSEPYQSMFTKFKFYLETKFKRILNI